MRKRWFLVGVVFLLVPLLLVGCGVAQEEYDAAVADLDKVQQELQSVKADLGGIQDKLDTAQTELKTTKDELAAKENELESSESEVASLLVEKDTLTSENEALQVDYDKLTDESDAVKQELADIEKVYPAHHFSSKKELQDWLYENDVSDRTASTVAEPLYEKALDIQEDALNDGYIISAYIDYYPEDEIFIVVLEAIADGDVFIWNPETDDLINFSEVSGLMTVRQ